MDENLMPKYYFHSVKDIGVEDIKKTGVKGIAVDIDNTLTYDGTEHFLTGAQAWVQMMLTAGFSVIIVSNATPMRARRIARKLGVPYVALARKPRTGGLRRGAQKLGIELSEMAMVGDQLRADVLAANNCGAVAIYVDPARPETYLSKYFAKRRRGAEEVLAEFERRQND